MPASIFAGSKVKALKSTLSLNGGADIISSTTNPQSSAISAEPGSLLLNTSSGTMYRKLDSGSTTNWVEVGAGSGGKNYIKNPDFDGGATTDWSMQKVSLSSLIPTGNIGAADAGHTILPSSSSPLEGANSLLVDGASAFTAGNCLVSAAFAIDREDMAKVMGWSFYYEAVTANMDFSGTSANTWAVYIAEVTTATPDTVVSWIQPAGVYNLVQGSGVGIASGTFQTTATGTAYRLVLVCINSEAAATTLKVDDFQLGPQKVIQGPSGPVGEIIATGSLTAPVGFLYCDGTAVSRSTYSDLYKVIGTTYGSGDGSTTFNLPDLRGIFARGAGTQTISGTTYSATLGTKQRDQFQGHVHSYSQMVQQLIPRGVTQNNTLPSTSTTADTTVPVTDGTNGTPRTGSETRPANVAVAYHIRYLATYQMSNDTDTRVVVADAYLTANTTAAPNNSTVDILLNGANTDTHGVINTSTGTITIPVSGYYNLNARIGLFGGNVLANRYSAVIRDSSDNVVAVGGEATATAAAVNGLIASATSKFLSAGTVLKLSLNGAGNNSVSQVSVSGAADYVTRLEVTRVSGPATIAASETVAASYATSAANVINTGANTWVDFPTTRFDTHGMATRQGVGNQTGVYTNGFGVVIPVSGKYLVDCMLELNNLGTWAAGSVFSIELQRNGSSFFYNEKFMETANTTYQNLSVSGVFALSAGDIVTVLAYQNSGTNLGTRNRAASNTLTVTRVGN